jgi:hypothetical protein
LRSAGNRHSGTKETGGNYLGRKGQNVGGICDDSPLGHTITMKQKE